MATKFEESQTDGPHALLPAMAGDWEGTCRTWFEPGKLGDTAPVKGSMRLVLGGRFLLHEYDGGMTDYPMEGIAIHGYCLHHNRWETSWVDSVHNSTRIMVSLGEKDASPEKLNVFGNYPAPEGPDWGWRTTLELRDPDNLIVSHYNITPDGDESLGVEFDYKRK